jgi:hypothetical protein
VDGPGEGTFGEACALIENQLAFVLIFVHDHEEAALLNVFGQGVICE